MQPGSQPIPDPETKPAPQIEQNLDALVEMHVAAEQGITRHQKLIERITATIAVPTFLVAILILVALWISTNLFLIFHHRHPWDTPPFFWLQSTLGLLSLVVTMLVVITQRRQGKVAELDARLDLQINLLVDQKASKIIKLLEEMRMDLPNIKDRHDHEAQDLQETIDPVSLSAMISDKLSTAIEEAENEPNSGKEDESKSAETDKKE